jgi:hypothetical protein
MIGPQHRTTADIVPLSAAVRRPRRDDAETEPRGTILLFTGVRYERCPDPAPAPVAPPPGRTGARRRRG